MPHKYRQLNGLTTYALLCGYMQQISVVVAGRKIKLTLEKDSACYHVEAFDHTSHCRLAWISESNLTDARDQWTVLVKKHFGAAIKVIKRDKRYTVTRELHSDFEPAYIARFCGDRVGHSETLEGAWMLCHEAKRIRMAPYEDCHV